VLIPQRHNDLAPCALCGAPTPWTFRLCDDARRACDVGHYALSHDLEEGRTVAEMTARYTWRDRLATAAIENAGAEQKRMQAAM